MELNLAQFLAYNRHTIYIFWMSKRNCNKLLFSSVLSLQSIFPFSHFTYPWEIHRYVFSKITQVDTSKNIPARPLSKTHRAVSLDTVWWILEATISSVWQKSRLECVNYLSRKRNWTFWKRSGSMKLLNAPKYHFYSRETK